MKVHIAVNVETRQIVAFEVTREYVHDGTMLEKLVEDSSKKLDVNGIICNGAYNSRLNFNLHGLRWIAESAFSWIKRAFGESVTAKKLENIVRAITMRVFRARARRRPNRRDHKILMQQSKMYSNSKMF